MAKTLALLQTPHYYTMFRASKKPITWSLILALTMISGVGEGLHLIPGCGHGIEVGDRVLLLGIRIAWPGTPISDRPCVERSDVPSIPMWDEDDCPICSLLAQCPSLTSHVQFFLVMPLTHDVAPAAACDAPSPSLRVRWARAPPLG